MKEDGLTAETQRFRRAESKRHPAELWLKLQNCSDLECERRAEKVLEIERKVQSVGAE